MRLSEYRVYDKVQHRYLSQQQMKDFKEAVNTDRYTFQKCSGMKDITGKRIYQGDICNWYQKQAVYTDVLEAPQGRFVFSAHSVENLKDMQFQVVSNVHEFLSQLKKMLLQQFNIKQEKESEKS